MCNGKGGPPPSFQAILRVAGLERTFASRKGAVHALRPTTFSVAPGEIISVVGESGTGKTTLARLLLRLLKLRLLKLNKAL